MKCNYLIYNITSYRANTECGSIKDKYDGANTDERISIIRDILDFYTDKATFAKFQKYYVHLIEGDENSYLNITSDGGAELDNKLEFGGWQTKFTREEIITMNPKFVPFMEEVGDDE